MITVRVIIWLILSIFQICTVKTFLKPITETLSLGSYKCNVNEVVGKAIHNRREREGV